MLSAPRELDDRGILFREAAVIIRIVRDARRFLVYLMGEPPTSKVGALVDPTEHMLLKNAVLEWSICPEDRSRRRVTSRRLLCFPKTLITSSGVGFASRSVHCPNAPCSPHPQHLTAPLPVSAHVRWPAAAIFFTSPSPSMTLGALLIEGPWPSCPYRL